MYIECYTKYDKQKLSKMIPSATTIGQLLNNYTQHLNVYNLIEILKKKWL